MKFVLIFFAAALGLLTATVISLEIPQYLVPETAAFAQERAVKALIKRTIGEDAAHQFQIEVDKTMELRSFTLQKTGPREIHIAASDGVSAAKGFHHYLKYYLNQHITWTNLQVTIPTTAAELPNVTLTSKSASVIIYYQNVCTWSYSFAWWSMPVWRRHIDWMAMQGISLTIAPIQEYIWNDIYEEMGLNKTEISEHFVGPAFQAWQRMGNIRGWGGPLPHFYMRMQKVLQQRILEAERDLGMIVALPAFAGHVPVAMERLYPNVSFTAVERWNRFPDNYCCGLFLDANEPLFRDIGSRFLQKTIDLYGSDHIYFCDPFNEVQPREAEANYLNSTASHIYETMRAVDAKAVWLLQGWMFVKNIFWRDELIEAFLTAVPRGKMLVLDLQSEQFPQYERTYSFYGQPFIWCMLHNFGGTLGMHGSVNVVNEHIRAARQMPNSSMIGVGITPEGIYQNYVMYELALERGWREEDFDLAKWFDTFADVEYGVKDARLHQAWQLLRKSVYSYYGLNKLRGKYTITRRPALNLNPWTWYNISSVEQALQLLLSANASIPLSNYAQYEHDLVDLTRQFLQAMSDHLYVNLIGAYKKKQLQPFNNIAEKLLRLFDDLEAILATNRHFLLGQWLERAKERARKPAMKRLYEMNARNQITIWGPRGQILDYANKQWSGIVRDYFRPRWSLFLDMMRQSLQEHRKFNTSAFVHLVSDEIENPFTVQMQTYPVHGAGNTHDIAQRIYSNWSLLSRDPEFVRNLPLIVRLI